MEQKVIMQLEVLKANSMSQINQLFREKVQLEEQLDEVNRQIQYVRGVLDAYNVCQKEVHDIAEGEKISEQLDGEVQ